MKTRFLFLLMLSAALFSCGQDEDPNAPKDTLSTGAITVSVDETYRPVIEQEKKVFDSAFPDAQVTIRYKPEAECIQDFLNQRSILILVTRELSADEQKFCESRKVVPSTLKLARDAVAVVVNNANPDSLFARAQLEGILTGEYAAKKYKVVFDNAGSSTLRFMQDSILRGRKLGANVYDAKSNAAVIDYVSKTPDAVGFVGMTYVFDSMATDFVSDPFIRSVRVAALTSDSGSFGNQPFKPYQAFVALRRYPLTRTLYCIHGQTYPGLAKGFANFLADTRGQLIFKTAQFLPLQQEIVIKEAQINTSQIGE